MSTSTSPSRAGRRLRRWAGLSIVVLFCAQAPATMRQVGVSWDEPFYFHVSQRYLDWARHLDAPNAFATVTLDRTFGLTPKFDDHPTLTKLLAAVAIAGFGDALGDFRAFRFATVILFTLLLAGVYIRVFRAWGRAPAVVATVMLATMPRLFTHAHIGATDAAVATTWFFTAWASVAACKNYRLIPVAAFMYGLAMATKFTGFFVIIPCATFAILLHRRRAVLPVTAMLAAGTLVFIVFQPFMWDAPFTDLVDYLRFSTTRAARHSMWMVFLGERYDFAPPWYYAPFMVIVTTPEVVLVCAAVGLQRAARTRLADPLARDSLLHAGFLLALIMAPGAPTHDGVRLFLPAFVFLAILAAYGTAQIIAVLRRRTGRRLSTPVVTGILCLGAALPLVRIYPYGLEYYNAFIGGVRGAYASGMQTTYWWTVVNDDALARINAHLSHNAVLRLFPAQAPLGEFYRAQGLLRDDIYVTEGEDFEYVLVLSRPNFSYPPIFTALGVNPQTLRPLAGEKLDGVPLWVLYRR